MELYFPPEMVNDAVEDRWNKKTNVSFSKRFVDCPIFYISYDLSVMLGKTDLPPDFVANPPFDKFRLFFIGEHRTCENVSIPEDPQDRSYHARKLFEYADIEVCVESVGGQYKYCFIDRWGGRTEVYDILEMNREISGKENTLEARVLNSIIYISMPDADMVFSKESASFKKWIDYMKRSKRGGVRREKKKTFVAKKIDAARKRIEVGFRTTIINKHNTKDNEKVNSASVKKSPHWRRGHFRRQLYGINNSKEKTIWIQPVAVNFPVNDIKNKRYAVV